MKKYGSTKAKRLELADNLLDELNDWRELVMWRTRTNGYKRELRITKTGDDYSILCRNWDVRGNLLKTSSDHDPLVPIRSDVRSTRLTIEEELRHNETQFEFI